MIFRNKIKLLILKFLDFTLIPLTVISLYWLKFLRTRIVGLWESKSKISLYLFRKIGVFPISDSYYEPYFNTQNLKYPLNVDRNLPGINFRISKQIELLNSFNFSNEIVKVSKLENSHLNYSFKRGSFLSGDSEILFSFIRFLKPNKIIEIGCGQSSLMIQHAIDFNKKENYGNDCSHICIEPFPSIWLSDINAEIINKKVEDVDLELFNSLSENDILFIDSSHIIRPQGDVLFEYLQILPILKKGVYIHIHDIFSPKDYLQDWLQNGVNFWNEQYLFEAFMSNNSDFEITLAVNQIMHNNYDLLKSRCPMLEKSREPGSMWIKKIN